MVRHSVLFASFFCWASASRIVRHLTQQASRSTRVLNAKIGDVEVVDNIHSTRSNKTTQALEPPKPKRGVWQVAIGGRWIDLGDSNQQQLEICFHGGKKACSYSVGANRYTADLDAMVQRARSSGRERNMRRLDSWDSRSSSVEPLPTVPRSQSFHSRRPVRKNRSVGRSHSFPPRRPLSKSGMSTTTVPEAADNVPRSQSFAFRRPLQRNKGGVRSHSFPPQRPPLKSSLSTTVVPKAVDLEEDEIEESDSEAEGESDAINRFNIHTPRSASGVTLKATQKALASSKHVQAPPPDGELTCESFNSCEECVLASVERGVNCTWTNNRVGCSTHGASPSTGEQRCFVKTGDPLAAAARMLWHLALFEKIGKSDAAEAIEIMKAARFLLMEESAKSKYSFLMTEVDKEDIADVFVFGDIHGSAYSIVPILRGLVYGLGKDSPCENGKEESNGNSCLLIECKPDVHYVFLGDYVDRGEKMLGVALMVMSLKLLCPSSVTLLRGNHETPTVNARYGFLEQLRQEWDGEDFDDRFGSWAVRHLDDEAEMTKSGIGLHFWYEANRAFGALPLSALVKGTVWCMHGGPPEGGLKQLRRPPPLPKLGSECYADKGRVCQLMWNDVLESDHLQWQHNEQRTVANEFGRAGLERLLDADSLDLILRGHDYLDGVWKHGYQCMFDNQICTVFTASQYMSAEKGGPYMRHVKFENANPGAVFWLHGRSNLQFRTRKGVTISDIQLKRGRLKASVITFDGLVLRHVARSLGCHTCLHRVPTRMRLPIRLQHQAKKRDQLKEDRMLSNVWVEQIQRSHTWLKKRSVDAYCQGGLGTSMHTLVGDWYTTKALCKLYCERDTRCNYISYFEQCDFSSEACAFERKPRRCRLSELCPTALFTPNYHVQILEKIVHSANDSHNSTAVEGANDSAPLQSNSLADRLRRFLGIWKSKSSDPPESRFQDPTGV